MCTPRHRCQQRVVGRPATARGAHCHLVPSKSHPSSFEGSRTALNASIFLTGWILFFIMLAFNMTVPSQDMGFMIEDLPEIGAAAQ